jgi:hypothetical protein
MFIRDFVGMKRFDHNWPEMIESFDAMEFSVVTDKGDASVLIGYTSREAFGKKRKRVVVFIDGHPEVEFNGTDDYGTTGQLVGLIKKPNSQQHYRHGVDIPPVEYTPFNIIRYKDYVKASGSYDSSAILVNVGEISEMIYHGLIQAKWAGRL